MIRSQNRVSGSLKHPAREPTSTNSQKIVGKKSLQREFLIKINFKDRKVFLRENHLKWGLFKKKNFANQNWPGAQKKVFEQKIVLRSQRKRERYTIGLFWDRHGALRADLIWSVVLGSIFCKSSAWDKEPDKVCLRERERIPRRKPLLRFSERIFFNKWFHRSNSKILTKRDNETHFLGDNHHVWSKNYFHI